MMGWICPIVTGKTFFDVWSLVHLAFWVFIGATMAAGHWTMTRGMIAMFIGAYAWEVFERYAEKSWPQYWIHPESWLNSWVSDPLMGVLGVLIGYWLVARQ